MSRKKVRFSIPSEPTIASVSNLLTLSITYFRVLSSFVHITLGFIIGGDSEKSPLVHLLPRAYF